MISEFRKPSESQTILMDCHPQIKAINLADVVQQFTSIELKRKGNRWVGLCPFHGEKTASFTIFEDNHYKCFGCGEYGDAVDLVRHLYRFDFKEALRFLGISQGRLSNKDHKRIIKQKQKRQLSDRLKQRERNLAYTLAFRIRSAYKSLEDIKPDNIDDHRDTLDSLSWWEYCHETLCNGSDDEKHQCCEQLKKMPTVKRNANFKPDFDLGGWVRGRINE